MTPVGNVFMINHWADSICSDRHLVQENVGGRAFITSASGRSYAHMEAEKIAIDPCMGVTPKTMTEEIEEECTPYFGYKVSGDINAAEVRMVFEVYLEGPEKKTHLFDPEEVELEVGDKLSLSGGNMYYFEDWPEFDTICIEFKNPDEMWRIFNTQVNEGDNPVCQEIVEAYERDYQEFETEWAKSKRPSPRPTPTGPTTPELAGGEAARPGLTA